MKSNMTVVELIQFLSEFPLKSRVRAYVNGYPQEFSLSWSGCDGCGKERAQEVSILIGSIESEQESK